MDNYFVEDISISATVSRNSLGQWLSDQCASTVSELFDRPVVKCAPGYDTYYIKAVNWNFGGLEHATYYFSLRMPKCENPKDRDDFANQLQSSFLPAMMGISAANLTLLTEEEYLKAEPGCIGIGFD